MILFYKTYEVEYEYIFSNQTKTILLLHGWGGNKDSFAKVKKVFKSSYNILSISFPPLNLYQPPNPKANGQNLDFNTSTLPLDMHDYKNIVLNILKLLNLNSIIIICHSFGFRVALMLTTTNITIEKIIVTGGAGIKLIPNFFKKLNNQSHSILLKSNPEYFNKFASSEYISLSYINRQTFKNVVNKDLTSYIKNLTCPTFLFWGDKDTATPIKMFKIFKKLKSGVKYKIIKNGTHFCYLDYSELFIDYCDKFLNLDAN